MAKKLKKITTYEASDREVLKSNTPAILPDNPSDHKWSAKQIKATMYKGILLLYDWFSKSVDEIDVILEDNGNTLIDHQNFLERLDQLKKANLDGLSRVIHETYATIEALSQETSIRNTTDIALNEAIVTNKGVLDNIVNGTTSVPKATSSNKAINDSYGNEIKVDNYIASIEFNYDSANASLLLVAKDQNGVVKSRKELVLPKETFLNNGYYDNETHEIVLVLNNSNTIRFSASDLIDTYSGDNTDGQIETIVDGRTIKAHLKTGSITSDYLSPNIITKWNEYEANEQSRENAEQLRATAEINRVNAETTRATNESTRQSQELTRQNNETSRGSNETTRQENEVLRQTQETNRQENETVRGTNEQTRVSAEANRVVAEQTRVDNESTRVNNETSRISAEQTRVSNESERQSNENDRQRGYKFMSQIFNDLQEEVNHFQEYTDEFSSQFVEKTSIVDDLNSDDGTKVLSAKQGKVLKTLIDGINAVLSSDDTDLDTIQELVNNIKANKTTIDSITTNKVNVTDIVDNLTSTETNKPLSAKQGKVLDEKIATTNTSITNAINTAKGYTDDEIAELSNVYQPIGNYQPLGDYVTTTTFDTYKTSITNALAGKVAFTDVVNATTNGVCPAYSNANSSSTDITSTQYVLTNDGKWHKLPSTAFSDHTYDLSSYVNKTEVNTKVNAVNTELNKIKRFDVANGNLVSDNLYNIANDTIGQALSNNGGTYSNNERSTSEFIKLEPNTTYCLSMPNFQWYNLYASNNPNSFTRQLQEPTFTTTSEENYLRLTHLNSVTDVMLNKGSTAEPYVPYFSADERYAKKTDELHRHKITMVATQTDTPNTTFYFEIINRSSTLIDTDGFSRMDGVWLGYMNSYSNYLTPVTIGTAYGSTRVARVTILGSNITSSEWTISTMDDEID